MHNEVNLEQFKKLVFELGREDINDVDIYTYIASKLLEFIEQNKTS